MRLILALLFNFLWVSTLPCRGHSSQRPDTVCLPLHSSRFALEGGGTRGRVLVVDRYQRLWQQGTALHSMQVGVRYRTHPDDSCAFAHDYGYPEWAATLSWVDASKVTMHKHQTNAWGQLVPVPHASQMGQVVAVYGSFSRPLLRTPHWQLGYALEEGLAYNTHPYSSPDNLDNELTGSHLLLYVGASVYAAYRLDARWTLRGDLAFRHVSNGAMNRPNKGANWLAPTLSVQYALDETAPIATPKGTSAPFRPYWYSQIGLSLGTRTLLEEWLRTQYNTPPNHPDYRTSHFRLYPTLNLQADVMRRYARRWASGVGVDVFFLPYVSRLRELDGGAASRWKHSPWSLGVAAKHEAFYGPLSLYLSLGYYLHRHTGSQQEHDETPYYERIGLRYRLPRLQGWSVGVGVKAHRTKADFTELTLAYDF